MTNVGDSVVPSTATGGVVPVEPIAGGVGLSTWRTAARCDDVRVTTPDGRTLFSDDFSDGAGQWSPVTGTGTWAVTDGAYEQTDTTVENTLVRTGDLGSTDYDVTLEATKTAGDEGFLVGFGVQSGGDHHWWNLGGWNGTQGAVEKATGGAKEALALEPGTIETGRTYDPRIEVRGTTAETTVITGDPAAENTRESQPVQPVTSTVHGIERVFTRDFPAHSVTFLRIAPR
ncbi:hypothetical protein MO973_34960 [Paenibacillus sp. TRM 82003]|nr:hypothetical protein [Kineococcus sp. TRM81007]MCI2240655.1 hypothetical protein [Kineococcus sp. TRM81007]MCI3925422.1 hypothetical protein [Paenibacillus sp. TRM 82003]